MIVNRKDLAAILGVTPPTIDARITKGLPVQSRGTQGQDARFDTVEVIRWTIEKAVAEATQGTSQKDDSKELIRRKLQAETEIAELKLAKEKAEVVFIEDALRSISDAVAVLRQRILTLPRRVSPLVVGETDEEIVKEMVEREVVDILTELTRNAFNNSESLPDETSGDDQEAD